MILPKINLENLELLRVQTLGASDPAPWWPQVYNYMTLTLTHSVTKMQLA